MGAPGRFRAGVMNGSGMLSRRAGLLVALPHDPSKTVEAAMRGTIVIRLPMRVLLEVSLARLRFIVSRNAKKRILLLLTLRYY